MNVCMDINMVIGHRDGASILKALPIVTFTNTVHRSVVAELLVSRRHPTVTLSKIVVWWQSSQY